MNFAQAFRKVREIARLHADTVSVQVEAWHHNNGSQSLRWSVWSDRHRTHYYGSTAEEAVRAYVESWAEEVEQDVVDAAIEQVGNVDTVEADQ